MTEKITTAIGEFEFDNGKLVKETTFSRSEILEKGKNQGEMTKNMLETFGQAKYLKKFREANLLLARRKVADSVGQDGLIIQAINGIDEIDKVANTMSKRLREWYELYNPEISHQVEDHERFVKLTLTKSKEELLAEAETSAEETMGANLEQEDIDAILQMARGIDSLYELRRNQSDYITKAMKKNYPNITAIAGALIGAKLLSIAGSIRRMAMLPASTIQLLGAEKALFRHMTTGAKPPKFGVIINHPLVTKAKKPDKGRVARSLADKISLGAKIDFFKGEFKGDDLRKELEARFS